jgi:uncharacterized protein YukE
MSDVHGNPDEIRQFARHLKKLANELSNLRNSTRSKMNHLNQSWRDKENAQFVEQFEKDIRPLAKLIKTSEKYSKFLEKKAKSLDNYLKTKM